MEYNDDDTLSQSVVEEYSIRSDIKSLKTEKCSNASNRSLRSNGRFTERDDMECKVEKDVVVESRNDVTREKSKETTLLALPCDAMHFIASFLTPVDWKSLSTTSKCANKVCRAVFRRVRLHGFRCASEVISAWVRGEHSDARELIALYVKNGVPIYPPCQGHTYSTLMWRMSVEAREMEGGTPETPSPELDRFYTDRYEARDRGVYFLPSLTYLEEKCLFWRYRLENSEGRPSYTLPFLQPQSSPRRMYRTAPKKKVVVKIHRHLANQHYLGHLTSSDEDAGLVAGTISLSSDFFHENGSYHDSLSTTKLVSNIISPNMIVDSQMPALSMLPSDTMLTDFILQVYSGTTKENDTALQTRFEAYFAKLSTLLDDSHSFEETLLDFWDEFFSKTAGIHFFDKHTPVPRMSTLHSFLTKPCPKSIGIVQCEIERIRRSPTSKSVKGRLFPTYEYRLFIRDRRSNERNDTVLMTARNRKSDGNKRGVNNYYLHMDETDLGRLQSNFIGTEFQIFSPKTKSEVYVSSESEDEIKERPKTKRASKLLRRPLSSKSRRAIANSEDNETSTTIIPPVETEDGAITYTANLLGNRPRVMDVCIPRLNEDGTECEWRRYIRTNDTNDSNRMLSLFKQLQEKLNTEEEQTDDYGLLCLQNRPPWWNFELGAFVLNFGGRVSVASVKNFQLCDRNDQEHIMLQFGRIQGRHSFTMDFQYPLTAVQAFAISISSLQSKISLG